MMINEKYRHLLTDDEAIKDVAKEILDKGYISLDEFLTPEAKSAVHLVAADRSNCWKKGEELAGTAVYELGKSDEVLLLSQRLVDARAEITGEPKVTLIKDKQLVGLPHKEASNPENNKVTAYHFDGAYINYLLPLVLPKDQSDGSGNLVVFPNVRLKYPKLVSKIVARMLRHFVWFRKIYGQAEVVYKVDSMVILFADLSFHGVDPISNGERVVITINSHW